MEEEPTCGKGLAENSELPAAFAALLSAVAENLEIHMTALNPREEKSKPEYEAYQVLAKQHRDLASQLRATADQMSGYRELPMAAHDSAVMASRRPLQAFEKFVMREKELLALLQIRVNQDAAMLADFRSAIGHDR